jgi:hypothetical protein
MVSSKMVQRREKPELQAKYNNEETHTLISSVKQLSSSPSSQLTRQNFTFLRQRRNTKKGEKEIYHPVCSLSKRTCGLL